MRVHVYVRVYLYRKEAHLVPQNLLNLQLHSILFFFFCIASHTYKHARVHVHILLLFFKKMKKYKNIMFKSNKRFNYQGGKFDKGYLATAQPNITKNV